MNSGIVYGYVGLIEGLVARIKKELGDNPRVIATGGYAKLLSAETSTIDTVERDITMVGMRLIYEMNRDYDKGEGK
jgi:type III pantothenate kinase